MNKRLQILWYRLARKLNRVVFQKAPKSHNILLQGCTGNETDLFFRGLLFVDKTIPVNEVSFLAYDIRGCQCQESVTILGVFNYSDSSMAACRQIAKNGLNIDFGTTTIKFMFSAPRSRHATVLFAYHDKREIGFCSIGGAPEPVDAFLDPDYPAWFEQHKASCAELDEQRKQSFVINPVFSIVVPLFNTPLNYLDDLVNSLQAQSYDKFELIFVNASPQIETLKQAVDAYCLQDKRIIVATLKENLGITKNTNIGIAKATGDFLCFLDHDDILTPDALYCYAQAINKDPDIDLLYCDEDMLYEDGHFGGPIFKPDFSMDMLCSKNYVIHFLTVRKSIVDKLEAPSSEFDGAQDYHMTFRVAELARSICHVPRVLYHWRISETSIAVRPEAKPLAEEAGRLAIERHLERCNIAAKVICSPGHPNVYELVYTPLPATKISTVLLSDNLSDLNKSALAADGAILLFVNCDCTISDEQTLTQLSGACNRPELGIVGTTTRFANGAVRSNGLSVGLKGTAENLYITHLNRYLPKGSLGYLNQTLLNRDAIAVDAVGLTIKADLFKQLGGFNEQYATLEAAAIDLCLRVRASGNKVIQLATANIIDSSPLLFDDESKLGSSDILKQDEELLIKEHRDTLVRNDSSYSNYFRKDNGFYQLEKDNKQL